MSAAGRPADVVVRRYVTLMLAEFGLKNGFAIV